jgi:hypothetical protein
METLPTSYREWNTKPVTNLHVKQKLRMHGALLPHPVFHSMVLRQGVNLPSSTTLLFLLVCKNFSHVKGFYHTVKAENVVL